MLDFSEFLIESSEDNAHALHASTYNTLEFLKFEQKAIFEKQWQLVGHVSQLKNTGDQFVVKVGKYPLVIVRNEDNGIRALHNVCRHRAGPVATGKGNSKVLRCKYHGWTYQLDGQLRSAPEMQSTPNFEVCQHKLPEAFVEIWQGFIFASIDKPDVDIEHLLANIVETIKPINLENFSFSHRDEYIIDCNWKVYMDNYLEGYHLPHVHPGLNKLLDYRSYDTKLFEWYSYQYSPLENESNNQADIYYGEGSAHYYCIFPNLMLNILPGRLQTNIILPEGHQKTKILFDYYYADLESESTKKLIKKDTEFSDEVQQEDIDICEKVQVGLNSGSYQAGRLCSKREMGVLHFQNLVRRTISKHLK
ncbi:MAG: aromatic ring-hydroxylating dioxygenase subunit alpha [Kangiellaceae bacterium]|nr:aromatic ring-hydroxylating dioxygenase subunit alpha [Kangiellaceae bacterium]